MPELHLRNRLRARLTAAMPERAERAVGEASSKLRNLSQNANNWDLGLNGEAYTIQRSCTHEVSPCIFDVGANEGHWASEALRIVPAARIYCFEPVPATFEVAQANLGSDPRVTMTCAGLGAVEGSEHFEVDLASHELASKYQQDPRYTLGRGSEMQVQILVGDQYVADHEIARIDLLKVDVEGMELEVLRGFDASLRRRLVQVVQFEYGVGYIGARTYLQDVFRFFEDRNFVVHELRPRSWRRIDYHFAMEDFNPRNFIAVLRDQQQGSQW